MTKPSFTLAEGLFDEHFGTSVDSVVIISYADLETAPTSAKQRRRDADRLQRRWNEIPNTSSATEMQGAVIAAQTEGLTGLYWCSGRSETVSALAAIYERIRSSRYADGYEAGRFDNGIGFICIWLDRANK